MFPAGKDMFPCKGQVVGVFLAVNRRLQYCSMAKIAVMRQ
jgi:hypothetical protein